MTALVEIAPAQLNGLAIVVPDVRMKIERASDRWLWSVLASAQKRMPNEAMYQFVFDEMRTWRCVAPKQRASPTAVDFDDRGHSVIDLHSHNSMAAFFSETDDRDEQGLRFYAVIGRIDTDRPEILVRVGVYGHFMEVPADMVFEGLGPFVDRMEDLTPDPSPIGEGSDDLIVGPMWGCALYAKDKTGDTQILAMMIAATDEKDALEAAMDEAHSTWPEYQGFSGHDCAVIYAHE